MTQPTLNPEALEKACDATGRIVGPATTELIIQAYLTSLPPVDVEPVAWRIWQKNADRWLFTAKRPIDEASRPWEPLYGPEAIIALQGERDETNEALADANESFMAQRAAAQRAHARAEAAEAEVARLKADLAEAQKKLNACGWYWPEDDTSSEACAESAQEVVQNICDWNGGEGDVIAVARGGIVEVTYCAALPPAEDADSDDDFWVEEATHEEAKAKIDAERERRARSFRDGQKTGEKG